MLRYILSNTRKSNFIRVRPIERSILNTECVRLPNQSHTDGAVGIRLSAGTDFWFGLFGLTGMLLMTFPDFLPAELNK